MSDLDLLAEFEKLCADLPAGHTGGEAYEDTLSRAVQRLMGRSQSQQAIFSTQAVHETGWPALDCPFMMSVLAMPFESLAPNLH